jgi:hypothetical protein
MQGKGSGQGKGPGIGFAAARRDTSATTAAPASPDAVKLIGATLRCGYRTEEDRLDDRLVALMLELSVEPPEEETPRQRLRLIP